MAAYEMGKDSRAGAQAVIAGMWCVFAVVSAVDGHYGRALTIGGLGLLMLVALVRWLFWVPHFIILDDIGLTFVAQWHTVQVPWADLEKVKVNLGRYGGGITWRRRTGSKVTTSAAFEGVHRMLTEVETRAPHARVLL